MKSGIKRASSGRAMRVATAFTGVAACDDRLHAGRAHHNYH
jgi:hypothetical protein